MFAPLPLVSHAPCNHYKNFDFAQNGLGGIVRTGLESQKRWSLHIKHRVLTILGETEWMWLDNQQSWKTVQPELHEGNLAIANRTLAHRTGM